MFSHLKTSKLNRNEFVFLGKRVSAAIETYCFDDVYLAGNRTQILTTIDQIVKYQSRSRKNPLRDKLKGMKNECRELFNSIDKIVVARISQEKVDPAAAASGKAIKAVFEATPISSSVSKHQLVNEIGTRIKSLDTVAMRAHLTKLGALATFDYIITCFQSIESLEDDVHAQQSNALRGSVDEIVEELKGILEETLPYIQRNCKTKPAAFEAPAKVIVEAISDTMQSANMRKGKKAEEDSELDEHVAS